MHDGYRPNEVDEKRSALHTRSIEHQQRIPETCNEYMHSEKRGDNKSERGSTYLRRKPQSRHGDTAIGDAWTTQDNPSFTTNVAGYGRVLRAMQWVANSKCS